MKAIKILGSRRAKVTAKAPMPELAPDCVLVKTMAVALNPTDWKHIDFISTKGATVGCDYAGIIQELGPEVDPALGLQVGDRVAGFTHGCNGENLSDGSFAEYIVAKAHINIRLPDWLPFTEGASLAVGITTVAQGLYQQLKMPLPLLPTPSSSSSHEPILIYGGSTATGTLAIQFAKLSGYRVIATCSPHNFPLVLDRGADHVLDHHSPTLAQEIRALTINGRELFLIFDCITTGESIAVCCDAFPPPMSSSSSAAHQFKYCGLFTVGELPRSDVEAGFTMAYTALGESFQKWDNFYPGRKEDARFIGDFMNLTSKLLEKKMIRAHPVEVGSGGLEGVLGGLERLRRGEVSGLKLVYTV